MWNKCIRVLLGTIALLLMMQVNGIAQGISQNAIDKAIDFRKAVMVGQQASSVMHFGTTYSAHEFICVSAVKDGYGTELPGHFSLVYRFWRDRRYTAELAVLCSANGSIESLKASRSEGIAQAPFLAAQATVWLIGNALWETFRDNMSDAEFRQSARSEIRLMRNPCWNCNLSCSSQSVSDESRNVWRPGLGSVRAASR